MKIEKMIKLFKELDSQIRDNGVRLHLGNLGGYWGFLVYEGNMNVKTLERIVKFCKKNNLELDKDWMSRGLRIDLKEVGKLDALGLDSEKIIKSIHMKETEDKELNKKEKEFLKEVNGLNSEQETK